MCGEICIKNELYSAKIQILPSLNEKDIINFILISRNKENNTIYDRNLLKELDNYNRIIKKDTGFIKLIFKNEQKDLENYLNECLIQNELENIDFIQEVKIFQRNFFY